MRNFLKSFAIVVLFTFAFSFTVTYAQGEIQRGTPIAVACGGIVDSEFTANYEEQIFSIDLKAGDNIEISIAPVGKQLNTLIGLTGPTNLGVAISAGRVNPNYFDNDVLEPQPKLTSDILSATGNYTVRVVNFDYNGYRFSDSNYLYPGSSGGIGAYTLYIGCTLRDGTVITPGNASSGDSSSGDNSSSTTQELPPAPAFSGTGFPGLPPVDFSSVAKIPLPAGIAMTGAITPTGGEILGYTLDASAGDTLDLTFTRLSGNLNLGLVVLSADNEVVFQASLVSSTTLNSRFTLPSPGQYTIGVFRIDLLPPDSPEATAFQIQGTLNP